MSLLLSSHHFSVSLQTSLRRDRDRHRYRYIPKSLFYPSNPKKFPNSPPISATTSDNHETLPKSAIQRIADKLRSLGIVEDNVIDDTELTSNDVNSEIGEVFVPNPRHLPNFRVGHTLDPSWSTPHNPVPLPGSGTAIIRLNELKKVAKKERKEERDNGWKRNSEEVASMAELTLSVSELRRLRTIGIKLKQKMKIGKAGITEGIVNGIHERWRSSEVVKLFCEDISRLNMKRTHDLLERKTGGLVVWRAGSKIVLYRGVDYKYPYFSLDESPVESGSGNAMKIDGMVVKEESHSSDMRTIKPSEQSPAKLLGQSSLIPGVGSPGRVRLELPGERQLIEEADRLLDGLGPRFTDWWGFEPLPVDADLLPAVVPGFKKPFRLLPYGVKPQLTNDEMTILKRLGRPLPCHFALGRNRKHQGLAEAILKLWEKCEIAKIAVKRGVQNTNSQLMAEELKSLTGGVLLSRDKEYIVFYRGKDFLPAVVSSAILERRKNRTQEQAQPSNVTQRIAETTASNPEGYASVSANETNKDQKADLGVQEHKTRVIEAAIKKTNKKLSTALDEKARAEKLLSELEQAETSPQVELDKEGITEEERYMLRKVGLKMKPFLLLGKRGVFDGTIENMHLHWKYRELVKIICGGWNVDEIHSVARTLEAESGGILVAVERVTKGHAIIVYRGKNYERPASLRPQTLLNKKEALKRSIEAQRRQSLKLNVLKLSKNIQDLKLKLMEDKEALDGGEDVQPKSHLGVEEPEPISIVSDENDDRQQSFISPIQEKILPFPQDTSEVPDKNLTLSGDTVQDEQTSTIIDSSISDEPETSHTETFLPISSDSDVASCDKILFKSTSHESDPSISEAQGAISKRITFNHNLINSSQENHFNASAHRTLERTAQSNSHVAPFRAKSLTNKERLLLRKEALKMKRRPVLAVGRSNVVTGVAKAIKDHFKKYPLAIVNVKGRAKGTSVKELVFQLEQETGGVLVSQEPSKVILYRGWGAGADRGSVGSNKEDSDKRLNKPSVSVSPELLAAMRVECGLSSS